MRILVTGNAGFIGGNFTTIFQRRFPGAEIIGIDDFSSGRREAVTPGIIFYEGSVTDTELLENIFKKHKPEYVFHFAAIPRVSFSVEYPLKTTYANVDGIVALLEKSKDHNVKRFIFSSSSSVYGGADKLPTKESENFPNPKSPYAGQKYAGEIFCKIFSDLYGLETVCLRYFNVYGPGQYGDSAYSTVISAWLESLYFPQNKDAFIEGDGTQSRDFCFVDNVVDANIKAMECHRQIMGEVFNIAHGERTTVNEVKELIEKYASRTINLEKRPPRMGDVAHTHADIKKAEEWLDFKPQIDFRSGLRKTVDWFEERIKK